MSSSLYKRGLCAGIKARGVLATKYPVSVSTHFSGNQNGEKRSSTNLQRKEVSPRFLRRIANAQVIIANPSQKFRIGTLPIEGPLAYQRLKKCLGIPSETWATLPRTGAQERAVHKANVCECTLLPYALRGSRLSVFTALFLFTRHGETQRQKKANGQACVPLAQAKNNNQGKTFNEPTETPLQAYAGALPKQSIGRPKYDPKANGQSPRQHLTDD